MRVRSVGAVGFFAGGLVATIGLAWMEAPWILVLVAMFFGAAWIGFGEPR